jgi:hypothetical protein
VRFIGALGGNTRPSGLRGVSKDVSPVSLVRPKQTAGRFSALKRKPLHLTHKVFVQAFARVIGKHLVFQSSQVSHERLRSK